MTSVVKPRRTLTTDRVVGAALAAADAQGIEGVSLRRLAATLGVTPMAIYRHVQNKAHLLDLMAERLLDQLDLAEDEAASWQDRLRRLLGSYLSLAAVHPIAPFLLSRPVASPAVPRTTEALLAAIRSAGFDARGSAQVMQVISGMILGPALHRATWAAALSNRSWAAADEQPETGGPTDDFPLLAAAEPFIDWSPGPQADHLTIELLVGGLETLARRPHGPSIPVGLNQGRVAERQTRRP